MKLIYDRFCFPVTFKCNLKCTLCAEHSPYICNAYYPEIGHLIKQLDYLFELVDEIGKFDITGGEPFLRKDLPDVITYIRNNFSHKIKELRITTNGTMLPPNGFTDAAKFWGDSIYIIVDNYNASEKSDAVGDVLRLAKIPYEQRDYKEDMHCNGWVDYGDLSLKHSKEEAKQLYHKCMVPKLGFFTCMVDGFIYPCARARLLAEHDIVHVTASIFDDALSKNGKKARLNDLLGDEVSEACRYCNGLCEDSKRYKPGEQLSINASEAAKKMAYESWRLEYGRMLFYTQTYNNEKTIARTIESVLNQTYKDFTYVIINNGSTDATDEIIRRYAAEDKRIVYARCESNDIIAAVHLPNLFLAYVPRYKDIYYGIVDGDDSIEPDFLEKVMTIAAEHDVDLIVPAANRINVENGEMIGQRRLVQDCVVSGRQKADYFYDFRPLLLCQWGKVYRRNALWTIQNSLFENYYLKMPNWFPQLDTVNVLSIFYHCDKVGFIAKPIYNFYYNVNSTCGSYFPDRIKSDVLTFHIYKDFLEKYGVVSKFNRDYCYAIYLSLLYDNISSSFLAQSISQEQKLADMFDILSAEETQQLFIMQFEPEFINLSQRENLLDRIEQNIDTLLSDVQCSETAMKVQQIIKQYRENG